MRRSFFVTLALVTATSNCTGLAGGGIRTVSTIREFETSDRIRISSERVSAESHLVAMRYESPPVPSDPASLHPRVWRRLHVCRDARSRGEQFVADYGWVGARSSRRLRGRRGTVFGESWDKALGVTLLGADIGFSLWGVVTCKAWEDINLPEELSVAPSRGGWVAHGCPHSF